LAASPAVAGNTPNKRYQNQIDVMVNGKWLEKPFRLTGLPIPPNGIRFSIDTLIDHGRAL
jgi:hypothetical protein